MNVLKGVQYLYIMWDITRPPLLRPLSFHIKITELLFSECNAAVRCFYLASPRLSSTTPDKALVYDSEVLFPIIHLIAVHMGAPGRTHDRQNIQFGFKGDKEKSPG